MEIKTIVYSFVGSRAFDANVNAAMAEGWRLTRREVFPDGDGLLYAELVKLSDEDELSPTPEPPTWQEAVEVLRDTCASVPGCTDCPALHWCAKVVDDDDPSPREWPNPYERENA